MWKQRIRGYKKQETEHQSVLCLNTELKTVFKLIKLTEKLLGGMLFNKTTYNLCHFDRKIVLHYG